MNPDLLARIVAIAADVFDLPSNRLGANATVDDVPEWDSLAHLNLTLAIEQEYGVRFSPEEMAGVGSIADWVALVEGKCRGAATK